MREAMERRLQKVEGRTSVDLSVPFRTVTVDPAGAPHEVTLEAALEAAGLQDYPRARLIVVKLVDAEGIHPAEANKRPADADSRRFPTETVAARRNAPEAKGN